jgi:hypothetical protein
MTTKYKFGDATAGADISDGLRDVINLMLDHAGDGAGRVMLDHVERIVEDAEPNVPVRTGALKASLHSYVRSSSEEVRVGASMGDGIKGENAFKIKFSEKPNKHAFAPGKGVFQTLIKKPVQSAIGAITNDIAKSLDGIASGRVA